MQLLEGNFALFCSYTLGFRDDFQNVLLVVMVSLVHVTHQAMLIAASDCLLETSFNAIMPKANVVFQREIWTLQSVFTTESFLPACYMLNNRSVSVRGNAQTAA